MFTQQQAAGVRGQVLVPVISLIPNAFMIARDTVQTRIEISVLVQTCMVYRHRQSNVLIAVPVSTIIIIDNQPQILLPLTSLMASISTSPKYSSIARDACNTMRERPHTLSLLFAQKLPLTIILIDQENDRWTSTLLVPVDGHWGRWSSWSPCSVTCGYGTHTRTRKCNDPPPKNGGEECGGDRKDVGKCLMTVCDLGKLMSFIPLKPSKMRTIG